MLFVHVYLDLTIVHTCFMFCVYFSVCEIEYYYCRLKSYIVLTFLAKNQSFRNKYGKTQPIRTKFGIRGQVKG